MALTGTLRDFGIAEILQLIGTQKKNGVLTVEDGKRRAEIEFAEGMVVAARGGEDTVSLEERLLRAGILTGEQLQAAYKKVQETLKPLSTVLISEGYLEASALREIIAQHNAEIVYEIFDWKTGTYAFNQKFVHYDKQFTTPIPAESIMMEGLRILDEGPDVRKLLPSLDEVYARVDRSAEETNGLEPETRKLYDLVDGQLTLKDVILASGQPKFDAMKRLAWMRANRYILRQKKSSVSDRMAPFKPKKITAVTMVALYALLAVVAAVVALKLGAEILKFSAPLAKVEGPTLGKAIPARLEQARLNRLRSALELYKLKRDRYPDRLDALVEEGILVPGDINPLWKGEPAYAPLENGNDYLLGAEAKALLTTNDTSGESPTR